LTLVVPVLSADGVIPLSDTLPDRWEYSPKAMQTKCTSRLDDIVALNN
jgi:hypothetical protein